MDADNKDDYLIKILELRTLLNEIDDTLINLLISRFAITDEIGKLKKANNQPIFDPQREASIILGLKDIILKNSNKVAKTHNESHLLESCIASIYSEIMKQSKLSQKNG